ncbi:hypothetical protein SAMN05660479_02611 [Microbulbifer thermotolerans]|nr:hypothetical protein SAMN05660479_02611 [Microbulbifer thermotolerans]
MSESKERKVHKPELKAIVDLEAVRGVKTISEIMQSYGLHPVLVEQWKKEIIASPSALFETKRDPKPAKNNKAEEERL